MTVDPSRQPAHMLQPAYPELWRALVEGFGPLGAFRILRQEALAALAAYVGDVPSQTPVKLRTVRYTGAGMPPWAIAAEGVYDMRLVPEWAHGYEQARRFLTENEA
jgi:hypothetical protein